MSRTDLDSPSPATAARWEYAPNDEDLAAPPATRHVYTPTDVWNQRSRSISGDHESPIPAVAGSNFVCANVHRATDGPPDALLAHFLVADFGLGSSFRDVVTSHSVAADRAAVIGQQWSLPADSSRHLCLAVELNEPSLRGRSGEAGAAHAQRNVTTLPAVNGGEHFAAVRNSGFTRRDLTLRASARVTLSVVAPETLRTKRGETFTLDPKSPLILRRMKPGETRWLRIANLREPIRFFEERDGNVVDGFTIVPRVLPQAELFREALFDFLTVCARLDAHRWIEQAQSILAVSDVSAFLRLLRSKGADIGSAVAMHTGAMIGDSFELGDATAKLVAADDAGLLDAAVAFLAVADAALTAAAKRDGDAADILHNVLWQDAIFEGPMARTPEAKAIRELCAGFIDGFSSRAIGPEAYPHVAAALMPRLRKVAPQLTHVPPHLIQRATPAGAQRIHRRVLLGLVRRL
jgi:hypothetical protein